VAGDDEIHDLCIVGGGIVGCATAMQLQQKYPKMKMVLVEKEAELGSCVILLIIYYVFM
jgi:L-2-hydroxyglutarate oxidase LhgO